MQQAFGHFLPKLDATGCNLVGNKSQCAVARLSWNTVEQLVQAITLSQRGDASTQNNGRILLRLGSIIFAGLFGHDISALA